MTKPDQGVRRVTNQGHYVDYDMPAHLIEKLLKLHAQREVAMPHERPAIDEQIKRVSKDEVAQYWKEREAATAKRSGRRGKHDSR